MKKVVVLMAAFVASTLVADVSIAQTKIKFPKYVACINNFTGEVSFRPKCAGGETKANTTATLGQSISAQGPVGPAGQPGARGASAFDPMPSGTTVTGAFGVAYPYIDGSKQVIRIFQSLPAKTNQSFGARDVVVALNQEMINFCGQGVSTCYSGLELADSSKCTGTSSNPTAPAGTVCIYPTEIIGNSLGNLDAIPAGKEGFEINFAVDGALQLGAGMKGVYAYTAP